MLCLWNKKKTEFGSSNAICSLSTKRGLSEQVKSNPEMVTEVWTPVPPAPPSFHMAWEEQESMRRLSEAEVMRVLSCFWLFPLPFSTLDLSSQKGEGTWGKWDGRGTTMRLSTQKVWELALIAKLFSHGACLKSIVELVTEIQVLRAQFSKSGF